MSNLNNVCLHNDVTIDELSKRKRRIIVYIFWSLVMVRDGGVKLISSV